MTRRVAAKNFSGASWRYPTVLLIVFAALWIALAIRPVSREDWLLENALTFIALPVLYLSRGRLHFSNTAYTCVFVFFCFHTIGSHYTYSEVPYDDAWRSLTGASLDALLGFERNQFDRLVHFLYGALIVVPSLELCIAYAPPRKPWRIAMPIFFVMAHSVIYEMIEWGAASVVAPELGQAYLGTQGDPWDSQKDMALATAGAVLTILIMRFTPGWQKRFALAR